MSEPAAAEDAYRKSLVLKVQIGNVPGQASTLNELANLYSASYGREEEAAALYRQAADLYVRLGNMSGEGSVRHNLAATLYRLRRMDEARVEIRRAIQCNAGRGYSAEPWKTWALLTAIESDAGNADAAADARQKSVDSYLAYRRDGGENHTESGRLVAEVAEALESGDAGSAATFLESIVDEPAIPAPVRAFAGALRRVVAGDRDRGLAAHPELDYKMAAEVLLLVETLGPAGGGGPAAGGAPAAASVRPAGSA
jgi:tetratricopeptide (TPR) repeat protein